MGGAEESVRSGVRRRLPAAIAAAAVATGAWWGLAREAPPPPAPEPPAVSAGLLPGPELVPGATLRIERGGAPDVPAIPAPEVLGAATARDYRERARYPRWSQPIRDGVDPLEAERAVEPARSMPAFETPVLVVMPDRATYEAPARVVLRAHLEEPGGTAVAARDITAEVRSEDGRVAARVVFRDDGRAPDEAAGDGRYVAVLDPGEAGVPELHGAYLVDVDAITPTGELRNAVTGFLYSRPLAHLTGRYRDRLDAGSLAVDAEVEVDAPARFHLEATLADAAGTPIAWAQTARRLEPGRRWLTLRFFGLALAESGRDGPYVLRSVALSTVAGMPAEKNDLVRDAWTTAAWRARDFSSEPFGDPSLLEAAARLEGSVGPGAPGAP